MLIKNQNLLEIQEGVIFSQVNCQKKMNSGLAKSIKDKWPWVYTQYLEKCSRYSNNFELLGHFQEIVLTPKLSLVNVFGQLFYGYDGKRYTDYGALKSAFENLSNNRNDIYFPNVIICKLP